MNTAKRAPAKRPKPIADSAKSSAGETRSENHHWRDVRGQDAGRVGVRPRTRCGNNLVRQRAGLPRDGHWLCKSDKRRDAGGSVFPDQ